MSEIQSKTYLQRWYNEIIMFCIPLVIMAFGISAFFSSELPKFEGFIALFLLSICFCSFYAFGALVRDMGEPWDISWIGAFFGFWGVVFLIINVIIGIYFWITGGF